MKSFVPALALALATLLAAPAAAQQALPQSRDKSLGIAITTGADYSVGSYGGPADTKILVVPFSVRATTGPLRVSATLPYLRIEGPGNIVGGGEGGPILIDPNAPAPTTVRDGLGDLSLGLTYSLPSLLFGGFDVDLGGRVKLPTSSRARGLGTGKTDFAGSIDVSRTIGTVTPFVTLGYRVPGDPDGVDLKNSVTASAGTSVAFGPLVVIGSYDYAGRTSALSEDSHSLFGALAAPVADRLTLTGYGTIGLSNGAPDYGVGLLLTAKLF